MTCGTFKRKIELKKYSREEYDSMLIAHYQQLYELQKKAGLIKGKGLHLKQKQTTIVMRAYSQKKT